MNAARFVTARFMCFLIISLYIFGTYRERANLYVAVKLSTPNLRHSMDPIFKFKIDIVIIGLA